jgi:hypothetical protein
MHTGKREGNIVVCSYRGVGLVVECLPSKQETRVRFSYAALEKAKAGANASAFVFSLEGSFDSFLLAKFFNITYI